MKATIQFPLPLPLVSLQEEKPQTMLWFFPEVTLVVNYHSVTLMCIYFFLKGKRASKKEAADMLVVFQVPVHTEPLERSLRVPGCDTARDATAHTVLVIPFNLNLKYSTSWQSFYLHFFWLQVRLTC